MKVASQPTATRRHRRRLQALAQAWSQNEGGDSKAEGLC